MTTVDGAAPERFRTHHLTYRQSERRVRGGPLYHNLHPMLAKRLDLWRLSNFQLRRLPSAEDVYVFHGVARDNPDDQRLFALAEVRDLTPARDATGAVRYPRLELMGCSRSPRCGTRYHASPQRERPAANRIVLYVRPPWTCRPRPGRSWPAPWRPRGRRRPGEGGAAGTASPTPTAARDTVLHVEGLDGRA